MNARHEREVARLRLAVARARLLQQREDASALATRSTMAPSDPRFLALSLLSPQATRRAIHVVGVLRTTIRAIAFLLPWLRWRVARREAPPAMSGTRTSPSTPAPS
jgi:hypothetical protein